MSKCELLGQVMVVTGTTRFQLARYSGVDESVITDFLDGQDDVDDETLVELLACMGFRPDEGARAVMVELTRSELRSWLVHRALAACLTDTSIADWAPTILANIKGLRAGVYGQPHLANLDRWQWVVEHDDVRGMRHALIGLDRQAVEMREVTPMAGLLDEDARSLALRNLGLSRGVASRSLSVRVAEREAAFIAEPAASRAESPDADVIEENHDWERTDADGIE